MTKPDCYECRWRGESPGSAYSACEHPKTLDARRNVLAGVMSIFAAVGRVFPVIGGAAKELNVRGNPHGIRRGWFYWPINFDPTWLESCDGFEAKTARGTEEA